MLVQCDREKSESRSLGGGIDLALKDTEYWHNRRLILSGLRLDLGIVKMSFAEKNDRGKNELSKTAR